jgi:predicted kinase
MEEAMPKPVFIAIGGLTGSGKTTLARELAAVLPDTICMDSDETRKELFGIPRTQKLPPEAYEPEFTQRLIEDMDGRIKAHLQNGKNVIVSMLMTMDAARTREEALAASVGADFQGLWLKADFNTMFDRVAVRTGDASDAGTAMVEQQTQWDYGTISWPVIDANQSKEDVVKQALDILRPKFPAAARKQAPPAPQ